MNLNRANRKIDYANAFRESVFGTDAAGKDIKFNTLQFRAVRSVSARCMFAISNLRCTLLGKKRNKSARAAGRVYPI